MSQSVSQMSSAAKTTLFAAVLSIVIGSCAARANTAYIYLGNTYNQVAGTYSTGGPYALRGYFVTSLSGQALQDRAFGDVSSSVSSYEFTDNSGLALNNFNSVIGNGVYIATDGVGNISGWLVGASANNANTQMQTNFNSPFGFAGGRDFSETSLSFSGSYGFVGGEPGRWINGSSLALQGGTLSNPLLLNEEGIAQITGNIGGVGSSAFYEFNWAGGNFESDFSMPDLVGFNSEILYELVSATDPSNVFASYLLNVNETNALNQLIIADGLNPGAYIIGIEALEQGAPDPGYTLTFDTPLNTAAPMPTAAKSGLFLMGLLILAKWKGRLPRFAKRVRALC